MPHAGPRDSEIYYETSGDAAGRPLILIEGLGAQLIGWRQPFVDMLAARGFFVIRLDNRDIGLSHKAGGPEVIDGGYTFDDMAGDVFSVMDCLGLASAHIVGQSMGGAIAQHMALARPERVASMVLFYTAPAFVPELLTDGILDNLPMPAPATPSREALIESLMLRARTNTSTDRPFDEAWTRDLIERSLDRCDRLDGVARQVAAVTRAGDWRDRLGDLHMPCAIIHGREDRLIKPAAAFELARFLKTSELHLYADLSHEISRSLWDDFVTVIDRTATRALTART